jgi:hypothetical protein
MLGVFFPPKKVFNNKNNHERSIHYHGDHPTIAETIPNKKKYILFNQAASSSLFRDTTIFPLVISILSRILIFSSVRCLIFFLFNDLKAIIAIKKFYTEIGK